MSGSLCRRAVFTLFAILVCVGPSLMSAQEENREITGAELQQAMYDALLTIEKARGLDSGASDGFYWYNADLQRALEGIPDKEGFIEALTAIKHRSLAARLGDENRMMVVVPPSPLKSLNGSEPFTPNYPDPYYDVDYQFLLLLGLAPDLYERCDGEAYAYYQSALYGASVSLRLAQMACDVAGCDPTGVVCASVCGATKIVQAGWEVLAEPVAYCDAWAAKLDAAENEAAFKNSEIILGDLDAHDTRIVSMLQSGANATDELAAALAAHDASLDEHDVRIVTLLASAASAADDMAAALAAHDLMVRAALDTVEANLGAHDAKISANLGQHDGRLVQHDADIKAMLAQMLSTVVANQEEIIKLLKTPEGKRPGWGKDGY